MSPTTQNDVKLSCALDRVIQMCRYEIAQAEQRRTAAETIDDAYQARTERAHWQLALTHLEHALVVRKR